MPVLKLDRSVRRRHFRDLLFLGIPFVGALVLGATTSWAWGAVAAVLLGLAGLYRQELRSRRFRCPTCGVIIRRAACEPGARLTFVCTGCDTEWDTGLRESAD